VQLSAFIAAVAGSSYVIVSLLTCRQPFNLDKMLHRGIYKLEDAAKVARPVRKNWLTRLLNIDENFTRGDKAITIGIVGWTVGLNVLAVGILLWTLFVGRLSEDWWFDYAMITSVWVCLVMAIITTIWFAIGVWRDLRSLFRQLESVRREDADDGTVVKSEPGK
jgi:SSS family solute:Na+ symporter